MVDLLCQHDTLVANGGSEATGTSVGLIPGPGPCVSDALCK